MLRAGQNRSREKLISLMINNALASKALPVYGEVYNLGGHNEKANIEIVRIILKELGKPESLITYAADRKGHDMCYAIAPEKDNARARPGTDNDVCGRYKAYDKMVS